MNEEAEWIDWARAFSALLQRFGEEHAQDALLSHALLNLLPARALQGEEVTTHDFLSDSGAPPVTTPAVLTVQTVPEKLWRALSRKSDGRTLPPSLRGVDWVGGNFEIRTAKGALILRDIQFRRFDFDAAFPKIFADHGGLDGGTERNSGGRPGQNHGEALAIVALRLSKLSSDELQRHNGDSVAEDIVAAYRSLGQKGPSPKNALTYAQGILRVVRQAAG